jgi:protein kinase C substrate 80K-H
MLASLALVLLGLFAQQSHAQTPDQKVRGVNPALAKFYASSDGRFTCLDGSSTFPVDRVNDQYCDCRDGSDEPGSFVVLCTDREVVHTY